MKYDLMLFDLDNTLICFNTAQKRALEKVLNRHNFPCSEERLHHFQKINDELWHSFEKRRITKDEVFVTRFKMLLKGTDEETCNVINDEFLTCLAEDPVTLPGVSEFLQQVKGKCVSGIVTNGDSKVQRKKLSRLPYGDQFDFVVVSEEAGAPKPSPEIFRKALNMAEDFCRDPDRILMIGDNLNADIKGALNMGFDACWYNPEGRKKPHGIDPTFEIRCYEQLSDYLML